MNDTRDWRSVYPLLVGLASFGILAIVNEARDFSLWRNYALSGIFMGSIVTWSLWHYDVRLPRYIQWIIISGLLFHYGGGSVGSPDPYRMGLLGMHGINGAYHVFAWWDNLTHGVGIGAGAMGIAYLLEVFQLRRGLGWPAWMVATLAILGALAAGVGVELYEFLGKTVFQTIDQGGFVNTMTDLLFNLLGAVVGAIAAVAVNRTVFGHRIQAQWGTQANSPRWGETPPSMVGFMVFVTVPATVALTLGFRFLLFGGNETPGAYDEALNALTQSALGGVVGGFVAAMVGREVLRRRERKHAPEDA